WHWQQAHRPEPGSDPGAPGIHARTTACVRSFHFHTDRWLIRPYGRGPSGFLRRFPERHLLQEDARKRRTYSFQVGTQAESTQDRAESSAFANVVNVSS